METLLAGLAFVLGGFYIFWAIIIGFCVCTVITVRDRCYFWAASWIGLFVFCMAYHFADVGTYMLNNPVVVLAYIGMYFVGGLFVSIGKWYYVVKGSKGELNVIRKQYAEYLEKYDEDSRDHATFEEYVQHKMGEQYRDHNGDKKRAPFRIKELDGNATVVLNTDRHPIPEWILFWPYTLLSYLFNPLWTIAVKLSKRMGRLYDTISAKMLSA